MRLFRRRTRSHKGDFGHIFIIAGSARYSGAAVLCAEAAMRTGAGLVTLGIPRGINRSLIRIKPKEVMTLPLPETRSGALSGRAYSGIRALSAKVTLLVIGPGLGREPATLALVRRLLSSVDIPAVCDADGINALAGHRQVLRRRKAGLVLTPHPGEMSRLSGKSAEWIAAHRKECACACAKEYNAVLVLKGHRTVIASPAGKTAVNTTGNPGMATAGSGDVLTGMIAALWGQGVTAFDAARYGVFLHGAAGDLAAAIKTQPGMIASDIIAHIPDALKGEGNTFCRRSSVGRAVVL